MISVQWREKGSEDYKVFVAARLTYNGSQGEFQFYDSEDVIQVFVSPAYLEAIPTINAPRKRKED